MSDIDIIFDSLFDYLTKELGCKFMRSSYNDSQYIIMTGMNKRNIIYFARWLKEEPGTILVGGLLTANQKLDIEASGNVSLSDPELFEKTKSHFKNIIQNIGDICVK